MKVATWTTSTACLTGKAAQRGLGAARLAEELAGEREDDGDAAQGGGVRQALHHLVGTAIDGHLRGSQDRIDGYRALVGICASESQYSTLHSEAKCQGLLVPA